MEYRIEHDSMGEVRVPADRYWGAQTERSCRNFQIGVGLETMPREITHAFGILKKAAAMANHELVPQKMTEEKLRVISQACDEVTEGKLNDHFPLVVWQTGSGTQSNMNANEVIANRANELAAQSIAQQSKSSESVQTSAQQSAGSESANSCATNPAAKKLCHPNDDINMSQSSNDTFPTAMHISAAIAISERVIPAAQRLADAFSELEMKNEGIVKSGRTHLQDAVPIRFSQEISGWRASIERDIELLNLSLAPLTELALGGTAVGTGLNAPAGFDTKVAEYVSQLTGMQFRTAGNKFHALTSKDELVFAHGALKGLAADLMKIANDIRWLASGPRDGLGEITIPSNEPGSSIMPGKVNPTQCEQVTMVAVQVMGNDAAVGIAASQGNFELNVFMPVLAYNFLQSARLLAESMDSFRVNCVVGIEANRRKMAHNLHNSLMLVTALNPYIGYENAARTAHLAFERNISLKEACVELGYLTAERFDEVFHPEEMA
ncbi:MAG: class II fumarate hydratase [Lachnospiraceae bacterium]|nr:class II fumarate hydratase [Lachnospiraceae bacterium]